MEFNAVLSSLSSTFSVSVSIFERHLDVLAFSSSSSMG